MSPMEPKALEWLSQQIDELGTLRNASVRDPQFKAWRQNTLTFIQRIWAGDTSRSERFRRIPFTPPSTRHDPRAAREHYERGCGEALEYLVGLRAQVQSGAVPDTPFSDAAEDTPEMAADYPTLELGNPPAPPVAGSEAPRSAGPPGLPPSTSGHPLQRGAHTVPDDLLPSNWQPLDLESDEAAPAAPPQERGQVVARTEARPADDKSRHNPLRDFFKPFLPAAETPESSEPSTSETGADPTESSADDPESSARPVRGQRGRKGFPRLKDMLGLSEIESRRSEDRSSRKETFSPRRGDPRANAPRPGTAPVSPVRENGTPGTPEVLVPETPAVAEDAPTMSAEVVPSPARAPEPPSASEWVHPEFMAPSETPVPLTADDVEPHTEEAAAPIALPRLEVEPTAIEPPHPATSGAAATDALDPADLDPSPEFAAHDATRAMEEFVKNSPVLRSTARPVQRRGAGGAPSLERPIPPNSSVAGQILEIGAKVDLLGVPEGQRARARAALMDLARQLDEPEVSWEILREAVNFVMEYPPLARKVLPLLLPFLDAAA